MPSSVMCRRAFRRGSRAYIEALETRQLLDATGIEQALLTPEQHVPRMSAVLAPGSPAPNIGLPYLVGGGMYDLYADTNRAIVLCFVATWHAPSGQTMPQIQNVYDWVQANGYQVTVHLVDERETPPTVLNYMQANNITVPVLMDAAGTAAASYDVQGLPVTYVISNQTVRFVHVNYSATLETDLKNEITSILTSPDISIADATASEGTGGQNFIDFTVSLSAASPNTVTVDYTTQQGTALAMLDFVPVSGTLVFPPGTTTQTISVEIITDAIIEPNEIFAVRLNNPVNGNIVRGMAGGTIIDDDAPLPPATISITDVTALEGDVGTTTFSFVVSLSRALTANVTADFATVDGTALAGQDYTAVSGTLTFAPGETSKTIDVPVAGNILDEDDRVFYVDLSNISQTVIVTKSRGVGTIKDDDPYITVDDIYVLEGNSGTTDATFTISLSSPTDRTVVVDWATGNGTAIAGLDFYGRRGRATFAPGQTSQTVTIQVRGDLTVEPDEFFYLNLTSAVGAAILDGQGICTILDDGDEPIITPVITIDDPVAVETDAGTNGTLDFTVMLSNPSPQPVTVYYTAWDGTAAANLDYVPQGGMITINPGEVSAVISIVTIGDDLSEDNETVNVTLTAPVNATIGDAQGTGTIMDNDPLPTITIDSVSAVEGNTLGGTLVFTVRLDAISGRTITVDYTTVDGTATGGVDYVPVAGSLVFAPGQTQQNITVSIIGDREQEAGEELYVDLSNVTNAQIGVARGIGTIVDDDGASRIRVTFGTLEIKDNQSKPAISFGVVVRGSTPPVRTFRVTNTGQLPLRLGTIVVPKGFELVKRLPEQLAPGRSADFTVRMRTKVQGYYAGHVRFATSDPKAKPFNFAIVGQVLFSEESRMRIPIGGQNPASGPGASMVVARRAPAGLTGLFATTRRTGPDIDWL